MGWLLRAEDYLRISGYFDPVRLFVKRPRKLNTLRLLGYPLVRLRPSPPPANPRCWHEGRRI
ncbi:MAG: hypothetical protein LM590_15880 [Thermofilum sp.]|nr:hypothetical protein [Thermofilum sp.]